MGWAFWRREDSDPRDAAPPARRANALDEGEGGRADPTAALRVRARRRLIGAAALLLAVAVILPMVLDKEPRPLPDSIPIDIPSEKTPFSPRLALPPLPEPGNAPVAPPPDATPAEETKGEPPAGVAKSATPAKQDERPAEPKAAKPAPKVEAKSAERASEEKRAREILEGKAVESPKTANGTPARGGKFLLQAAALGSESAAHDLSDRLKKAGFAPFTERTDTKDGVRYRVRLGPYATRDEAERARARLRAIGINASVVTA
jgi:DedD protein